MTSSWILELKKRLAEPPPHPLPSGNGASAAGADDSLAVLVPLYVEAGELWVYVSERPEIETLAASGIAFPAGAYAKGENPWEAAARSAEGELGLGSNEVLRIGELDAIGLADGTSMLPCVAAVPSPGGDGSPLERSFVLGLPLVAVASPRLVEQQVFEHEGQAFEEEVWHVGRHRIFGPMAWILRNLLERLGLAPA